MKKIFFSIIIIFTLCSCSDSESIHDVSTTETATTVTSSTTETIPTTNIDNPTEKDIIRAIEIDMNGDQYESYLDEEETIYNGNDYIKYLSHLDYLMKIAEGLSNQYLGEISDENDLQEKARVSFMELISEDFIINRVEIDSVEKDGKELKIERMYPYYNIKYYEDYDV